MRSLVAIPKIYSLNTYMTSDDFLTSYYRVISPKLEADVVTLVNQYFVFEHIVKRGWDVQKQCGDVVQALAADEIIQKKIYQQFAGDVHALYKERFINEDLAICLQNWTVESLQNFSLVNRQRKQRYAYLEVLQHSLDVQKNVEGKKLQKILRKVSEYPSHSFDHDSHFLSATVSFLEEQQDIDRMFGTFLRFRQAYFDYVRQWIPTHLNCLTILADFRNMEEEAFLIVVDCCEALSKEFSFHFEKFLAFRSNQLRFGRIRSGKIHNQHLKGWIESFSFFELAMNELLVYFDGKEVEESVFQTCLQMSCSYPVLNNVESLQTLQALQVYFSLHKKNPYLL